MFHEVMESSSLDKDQLKLKKGDFKKSCMEIVKHLCVLCYHNMKAGCSIRNSISFVTSICPTDGLNRLWSKHSIGRPLSENWEFNNFCKFYKCWPFLKEKWKNQKFQSLVCYHFFQTSNLVTKESGKAIQRLHK